MDFHSLYEQGFARVAAVTLPVHDADPLANAADIIDAAREASNQGAAVVAFPELSVSGYAIDDLLLQDTLLDAVEQALGQIRQASADLLPLIIVGAPLACGHRLYNCAVAIHRGDVVAITPKTYLPNYREFYEKRHFASLDVSSPVEFPGRAWLGHAFSDEELERLTADGAASYLAQMFNSAPFGTTCIRVTDVPGLTVSMEICEDMWVPIPPSARAALAGASVIVNLSASPITVGRADDRRLLVRSASARTNTAYIYCAASRGESSTDLSWDGQSLIYEAGDLLAEGERFPAGRVITYADVDLDRLRQERMRQGSFDDNAGRFHLHPRASEFEPDYGNPQILTTNITLNPPRTDLGLRRPVDRFPFVPNDPARLEQDCFEAYNIQVSALEQRLRSIGHPKIVIGVSGGLDSTHALIVAAKAMDRLERPRTDILAYTLPGFATSAHTKNNATKLCERLAVSFEEIDITPAAKQMLADLGHPYASGQAQYDVTFENVQAGLRTDYLFRLANHHGGIVLGTGDLSELALGWCTYGVGDQMSHYAVNTGLPKTMIQHLIRWVVSSHQFSSDVDKVLLSILDTEISPELVPAKPGEEIQSTESLIGPYNLQDFTLFYLLRRGYRPGKIAFLAEKAWADASQGAWPPGFPEDERVAYSLEEIVHWEKLFLKRFFANQFKRTAIPNGPKVMAGGSLSPRGDWRMPSDVSGQAWLDQLEQAVAGVPGSGVPALKASSVPANGHTKTSRLLKDTVQQAGKSETLDAEDSEDPA